MDVYGELLNYYANNYKKLLFYKEIQLPNRNYCKLYTYDYDNEIDYFAKTFNMYLPFYADSYGMLKYYRVDEDFLIEKSKKIWKNDIKRKDVNTSGVFGELLLDFYTRIVCSKKILACYASKGIYRDKLEFKGIDCIGCSLNNDKLEVILSEAKFVKTLSSAKSDLISDINGEHGHLNSKIINSYCCFAMKKSDSMDRTYSESIIECLNKINIRIVQNDEQFNDIMNDLDYSFKFVYFAIYKSDYKQPNEVENYYKDIIDTFNKTIGLTTIKNYSIEIVFIPTNNDSVLLKNNMVKLYG